MTEISLTTLLELQRMKENPRWARLLTRRAFRNRITGTESRRIELAIAKLYQATATPTELAIAADLAGYQRKLSDGPYVDLDDPVTVVGVNALAALGLLDAPTRVAELLLDATETEAYRP